MYNAVSGETVTYTYDSASGSGWSNQYGFDSFGNLLSKTVTAGSGPSLSQAVNAANNQIVGYPYDANGNTTVTLNQQLVYDAENRLSSVYYGANGEILDYGYDAQNRRIWSWLWATDTYGNTTNYTLNMYTPGGQKLGAYQIATVFYANAQTGYQVVAGLDVTLSSTDTYFGSRRLAVMDQLGSAVWNGPGSSGSFFPWGEAKGGYNPQDTWNFGTYWQDSTTGLDYANNRYYSNAYGRFMTPDPSRSSGGPGNPQSWNRYACVSGDPVNFHDPGGLMEEEVCSSGDGSACDDGGGGGDFGGCDASQENCDNPCVGADGFTPSASPYCQYGGPPPEPAPVSAPPTPSCSISLYERPAGGKHRPWQHTYIVIDDPFLQQSGYAADELILQAGPSNNFPIGGTLQSEIVIPGTGYGSNKNNASNPATNKEISSPYTGANACLDVLDLLGAIANYNDSKQVRYMAVPIPFVSYNSNSFTSTLLNDVGLSFGSPGFAPGWGPLYSVPGLVP